MDKQTISNLKDEELADEILKLKDKIFWLKFLNKIKTSDSPSEIKIFRKTIAKLLTEKRKRELHINLSTND